MKKVGPSEKTDGVCDNACLLVNQSFPGTKIKDMAKLFQGYEVLSRNPHEEAQSNASFPPEVARGESRPCQEIQK